MKSAIRDGVWETNSSSTHSICIHNDDNIQFPHYIYFGIEDIESDGSYWYDGNHWATIQGRANYLNTILAVIDDKTEYVNVQKKLKDWLNEINVKSEWKKLKWNDDGTLCGYYEIKDSCSDVICNKIINDKILFYKYLFGKHSQIIMGYDELYDENKEEAQKKYPEGKEFNYYVDEY